MKLPDWGTAVGAVVNKVTQWIPSPKQAKLNAIDKLENENVRIQQKVAPTDDDLRKYAANADRVKLLRKELERLD